MKTVAIVMIPVQYNPAVYEIEPTLEGMRAAIGGGWLECLRIGNDAELYFDEEGLLKKMPLNVLATRMAGQPIVGDAFLVGPPVDGKHSDVPTHIVDDLVLSMADWSTNDSDGLKVLS